jgi:hypothetical protein
MTKKITFIHTMQYNSSIANCGFNQPSDSIIIKIGHTFHDWLKSKGLHFELAKQDDMTFLVSDSNEAYRIIKIEWGEC